MEKSSFFNSVNGDRKYQASDFAEFFNSLITNGIFPNPSTNLQALSNSNMTVTVKAGKAWINGYVYILDADMVLPIDVADGVLNRIDRIAIRFDTTGRAINAVVKKGTFASSPVALALQRDADGYELGIADIYIAAGATSISQSNITDQRFNTNLCGIVSSLITADTTTLFNQFADGFNTWFNGIKNTLGSDVAGNLLNQINNLAGDGRTTETVKGNADAIASHKAETGTETTEGHIQLATAVEVTTGTETTKAVTSKNLKTELDKKIDLTNYQRGGGYAVTTGTSTAYTITLSPAPTAYVDGQQFIIVPNVDCGATPTLNVNSLGAGIILKQDGSAISAGDIKANNPLSLVRVGSNFFIRSSGGSNIKSLQRGTGSIAVGSTTTTATIGAVDLTKAIVLVSSYCSSGGPPSISFVSAVLTNSTTITFTRGSGLNYAATFNWTVIELNNLKSLQSGTFSTTSTPYNLPISSVNTTKAIAIANWSTTSAIAGESTMQYDISSSTNVTFSWYNGSVTNTVSWFVIEFN